MTPLEFVDHVADTVRLQLDLSTVDFRLPDAGAIAGRTIALGMMIDRGEIDEDQALLDLSHEFSMITKRAHPDEYSAFGNDCTRLAETLLEHRTQVGRPRFLDTVAELLTQRLSTPVDTVAAAAVLSKVVALGGEFSKGRIDEPEVVHYIAHEISTHRVAAEPYLAECVRIAQDLWDQYKEHIAPPVERVFTVVSGNGGEQG